MSLDVQIHRSASLPLPVYIYMSVIVFGLMLSEVHICPWFAYAHKIWSGYD